SGKLYPALDHSPYTAAPYGPLFYVGLTALAKSAHLDFDHLLIYGRIPVLISFLLLPLLAYLWERRQAVPVVVALIAPAFILAQIDFLEWNVSVRPDLLALAITLATFLIVSARELSWRRAAAAGILCAVAALLKQSFIALPLAIFLWLLLTKRLRHLTVFVTGGVVITAVVLGTLSLRHEPYLQEMLLARYSPVSARS